MANFVYTYAKSKMMSGDIDLNSHDIRAILVMTNTTADTEADAQFVGSLTTLDEMDGTGYTRQTLTGEAVAVDTANNRGEFTADDHQFLNVSAGTRTIAGLVLYRHVTNDADSPLIAYIDTGASLTFPLVANGGSITVVANAEGLVQVT